MGYRGFHKRSSTTWNAGSSECTTVSAGGSTVSCTSSDCTTTIIKQSSSNYGRRHFGIIITLDASGSGLIGGNCYVPVY